MKKKVELPIAEPMYSTYHFQGSGCASIYANPSIRNWYLNETINLQYNKKYLYEGSFAKFNIVNSSWASNPCFEKLAYPMKHINGYINPIIRDLLDHGYYLYFSCVDDYYVENKSWYKERHFSHDGLICGYDQEQKTYSIFAYDRNWVYRKFLTSQQSFNKGRCAMMENGVYGQLVAIKPKMNQVEFRPDIVLEKLIQYLDSSFKRVPQTDEGPVFGVCVHDYVNMYIELLDKREIPYEKIDRRIFRLIWEHKKVMQERIFKMEKVLELDTQISDSYKKIVNEADTLRLLYASHCLKRRDSLLPIIHKRLSTLKESEIELLSKFVSAAGGAIKE